MKCTRERQKSQVMSGGLSDRPILAPAGHAGINELGIAGKRNIGAEAKALHDTGPEAFDERIGFFDDPQAEIDGRRVFEVEQKRPLPAINGRVGNREQLRRAGALDAQHIRSEVREQHPAIGSWAKPGKFEHADAR